MQEEIIQSPDDHGEESDRHILLEHIEAAERRLANGEGVSHEEAKRRMEAWLK